MLLLGALTDCSAADRPPAQGDVVHDESRLAPAPAAGSAEPGSASADCEPRAYRTCHLRFVDDQGQLQCPEDVQICRVDGSGWLACGMFAYDVKGDPQPRL